MPYTSRRGRCLSIRVCHRVTVNETEDILLVQRIPVDDANLFKKHIEKHNRNIESDKYQ